MIDPVITSWTNDDGTFVEIGLPEPSYVDQPEEDGGEKGYGFNGSGGCVTTLAEHGVYAYGGKVYDQFDGWTPTEARTIASWWLAAAAAAERNVP